MLMLTYFEDFMMPNKKTTFASLGSRCHSSQRREAQQKERQACNGIPRSMRRKPTTTDDKTPGLLKVKLPKLAKRSLSNDMKRQEAPNGNVFTQPKVAEMDCKHLEDPFFFSQGSQSKASSDKEKARLSVLKTISRMVEENQLIRKRLAYLKQSV